MREHGDGIVAIAEGIADRSGAEALRGARIFIERSSFPKRRRRRVLLGRSARPRGRQSRRRRPRRVVGLIDTGPHSVLRVAPPSPAPGADAGAAVEERLIPFVSAYVDSVDLAGRRVVVDWGLDY